jgi:hypothetical protein
MSDETLIERAAALLRQTGSARQADRLGGEHRQWDQQTRRADREQNQIGLGRAGTLVMVDEDLQPIPAPIVEQEHWGLRRLLRVLSLRKIALAATTLLVFAASAVVILSLTLR